MGLRAVSAMSGPRPQPGHYALQSQSWDLQRIVDQKYPCYICHTSRGHNIDWPYRSGVAERINRSDSAYTVPGLLVFVLHTFV
jgi:hypothetical protein